MNRAGKTEERGKQAYENDISSEDSRDTLKPHYSIVAVHRDHSVRGVIQTPFQRADKTASVPHRV